jgi:hypothetical protein
MQVRMMSTTIDKNYTRLENLGVDVGAIRGMNLTPSQIEELCQRIERLMAEERC